MSISYGASKDKAMNDTQQLEEALALALKLPPADRLRLVERVVVSVEQDIAEDATGIESTGDEHWGKSLNRLMDEIGPIEMLYPEIEDPVAWVKHLRAQERRRRLGDWGEENRPETTE
jgi:hypothetical protein